jgi:hypothetical protein
MCSTSFKLRILIEPLEEEEDFEWSLNLREPLEEEDGLDGNLKLDSMILNYIKFEAYLFNMIVWTKILNFNSYLYVSKSKKFTK